jgi:hypothetical protein
MDPQRMNVCMYDCMNEGIVCKNEEKTKEKRKEWLMQGGRARTDFSLAWLEAA